MGAGLLAGMTWSSAPAAQSPARRLPPRPEFGLSAAGSMPREPSRHLLRLSRAGSQASHVPSPG
jgi:hypothetical protein